MNSIWVIGAGQISREHAKVLTALALDFTVIGRGEQSASSFTNETGVAVKLGGLKKALEAYSAPQFAILAIPISELAQATLLLLNKGIKNILIEKPGATSISVLKKIQETAAQKDASVYIAYNRRFYTSTREVSHRIKADGGVKSVFFEFNEPEKIFYSNSYPKEILQKWFLANSTHVVDLVFHLCGRPQEWRNWYEGGFDTHPSAMRFAGAGILESGALFSYLSDWQAPGRWGIEIMTTNSRLILRPMERLQIMTKNSFEIKQIDIDNTLDVNFKPGFFLQMEAFVTGANKYLCSIDEHTKNLIFYSKIANYSI